MFVGQQYIYRNEADVMSAYSAVSDTNNLNAI
jgi:hypothetical protein